MNPETLVAWGSRLDLVLECIKKYRGGKIVKYRHPLHDAIRGLEELCKKCSSSQPFHTPKQPYMLHRPARDYWYILLDLSRYGEPRPRLKELYNKVSKLLLVKQQLADGRREACLFIARLLGLTLQTQYEMLQVVANQSVQGYVMQEGMQTPAEKTNGDQDG